MTTTERNTMTAYHGNPDTKNLAVHRAVEHRRRGRYKQGAWVSKASASNFRGCHIGCLAFDYAPAELAFANTSEGKWELLETELGIPERLLRLFESVFEGLPAEKANLLTESVLDAIPVGADLSPVHHRMAVRILSDVRQYGDVEQVKAIDRVIELHRASQVRSVSDETWSAAWSAAEAAESAAWSAARLAARLAARSAAEAAAESAARSAAESAVSAVLAARSAARLAAEAEWSAAWSAAWERIAGWLLVELADASVPGEPERPTGSPRELRQVADPFEALT